MGKERYVHTGPGTHSTGVRVVLGTEGTEGRKKDRWIYWLGINDRTTTQ